MNFQINLMELRCVHMPACIQFSEFYIMPDSAKYISSCAASHGPIASSPHFEEAGKVNSVPAGYAATSKTLLSSYVHPH
jgi:hypothetical protein